MFQILLISALASLASAATVTYNFNVGWVNAAPDGYPRPVIGINGQWPIPIIEANVGDTIVVNLKNNLGNQSTSLHFHGMRQQGTIAYDGGVGVSQCPIYPGDSFTYKFTAYPAGTFWYHSHDDGQYPDGLRGKMIVHDPVWEKNLGVEQQIYLSMSDWYHTQQPYLISEYLSPNNTSGDIPSPDSFLFNDTRTLPTFRFTPGKKYLLRIVSLSALACGYFHIDGHTLTVVGIDGVHTQPQQADTILICAGQRYDVVVVGKSGTTGSYQWIAKMTTDMLTHDIPSDDAITVIGNTTDSLQKKLRGIHVSALTPSWTPQSVLDDMTLKPLDNTPLYKGVTQKVNFKTNQTYYEGIGTRIGIGKQPWVAPKVPSAFTALSTGVNALKPSTYGVGVDPHIVNYGDVVQIYMENPQSWPHPMHLHGHEFQTVARGSGTWDGNEAALPAVPMMRDTVVIPANGYFVLRFKADNPGVWFFHCHIDLHLVGGMAAIFIEAPDKLQQQQYIPGSAAKVCKNANMPWSGNCAGEQGAISEAESQTKCNTIFNSKDGEMGACVSCY